MGELPENLNCLAHSDSNQIKPGSIVFVDEFTVMDTSYIMKLEESESKCLFVGSPGEFDRVEEVDRPPWLTENHMIFS